MKFLPTPLRDAIVIEQDLFRDPRGLFLETYHGKKYAEGGLKVPFVQDNLSQSVQGTLRGLHGQLRKPQAKLVRVVQGEVFDVAVDARPGSATFGRWLGETLSLENGRQLYVPPGFLHGFCVLSPVAVVEYKCSDYYDPKDEIGVKWDDPTLQIQWPIPHPLLSEKDGRLPLFSALGAELDHYRNL